MLRGNWPKVKKGRDKVRVAPKGLEAPWDPSHSEAGNLCNFIIFHQGVAA